MTKLPPYNAYWVIPEKFMAGEYPGHRYNEEQTPLRLDALLEAGISTFIDLTEPHERVPYEPVLRERAGYYEVNFQYQRFSIGDYGIPSAEGMRTILDTLHKALTEGRTPYIHCWAGMGRTGTAVGCYLVEKGLSGAEALLKVDQLCYYAPSPQTKEQKDFVRNWKK
ncbi:MAG: phosphatase [Anaerolineae bacterium]|jgi:protein-tyrosine phosphatase|nr:phosphatase [Anaerolineae bacterium]MBT7072827.1 phosphatase [Anaerolineae bacterium]MBT7325819.1 phosphatase [Anaerolineae bacterium]MBT7600607.1 phosphatase [Anaerolineae bacterium]